MSLSAASLLLVLNPFPLAPIAGDAAVARPGAEVARQLATELEKSYVLEDKARAMAAALRAKAGSGAWDALAGKELAEALTETCHAVIKDLHLRVTHEGQGSPRARDAFFLEPDAARREWKQRNQGFERAERLQGNVGYLELREFVPLDAARETAAAAMTFLQDTDALVIDLRRNGGGDPETVRFLCSYLFGEEPVHLNTLVNRELGTAEEYWTLRDLPGRRYGDKPVYVLVSGRTFSAAEEFTYNLQCRQRATIVGKTTGGGAHPIDRRRLGDGYSVTVPIARAENPVTKTNWEAVGVKPNVDVAEDAALDRAWALALEQLVQRETDPGRKQQLESLAAEKRGKSGR